jgi:ubiquinone/menaquinone biosynthesis C-methylase UbiE
VLLGAVPEGATYALDVGCGEGVLARQLRERVPQVTGIDLDEPSITAARAYDDDIAYVFGDAMTHPFAPESFDVVTCVAVLHHLGTERGLVRLASLVKPGGVLGVIGLGARSWADLPYDAAGFFATRALAARHGRWNHSAPCADPDETNAEVQAIAHRVLPGCRFKRRVLFRHTIVWRKPTS